MNLRFYRFVNVLSFSQVNTVVIIVSAWLRTDNLGQVTSESVKFIEKSYFGDSEICGNAKHGPVSTG